MPDVAELALHVQEAFDEFQALPPSAPPTAEELPKATAPAAKRKKKPPVAKATRKKG
jgi:hypothetical protein